MQRGNFILHRGYRNGKRFSERVPYKPYLFVPSKDGEYRSLVGKQPLAKLIFDSISDAREFKERYDDVGNFEYHGMDRWVYPFINDEYQGTVEFDPSLIRVAFLDIEVDTRGGYPDIRKADKEINAITLSNGKWYKVFGLKSYDLDARHKDLEGLDIEYYQFRCEQELLQAFLRIWRDEDFDAITGWNVEGFDIPYMWKRYAMHWGDEEANKLSPLGSSRKRTFYDKMGRENDAVDLHGIAMLDYMQLYLKFKLSKQESYSLRFITTEELGVTKLDYEAEGYTGLDDLWERNHQMFIDYNVIDVARVVQLDKKMGYLNQVYAIAYDAKINLEDAITSVLLWDVIIHNKLMERKIAVPKQKHSHKGEQIRGAYVKEPRPGSYDWVMSFDLDSLYPHIIMQWNISPETFMGVNREVSPETILSDDFALACYVEGDYALAGNGALFRRDEYGIIPELMQAYYDDRKKYKNMMLDFKKKIEAEKKGGNDEALIKEWEAKVILYNNLQGAKKVGLNSAYGALSNEYFRYYNDDLAEAITCSGQVVIQWAQRGLNQYINRVLKNEKEVDYVIASDTDSLLMCYADFVNKAFNGKVPEDELKVVDFLDNVSQKALQPKLEELYTSLAQRTNSYQQKMRMKREKIASRGLWTGAKRYIMNVWDNEGVRYKEPDFVMVGIEAVRSSTPRACREWIEEGAKVVITLDQEKIYNFIEETRSKFDSAPFEDIALNSSYNNKKNYVLGDKSVPMAVAAGLNYNRVIMERGLENTKQRLSNGDRIKFCQLKLPNPTREKWFGVPVDAANDLLGMDKFVDREHLWKNGFYQPMETLATSAGLQVERRATLEDFFS